MLIKAYLVEYDIPNGDVKGDLPHTFYLSVDDVSDIDSRIAKITNHKVLRCAYKILKGKK